MPFKPGQSGNPAGRKPGITKLQLLKKDLVGKLPGYIAQLEEMARAGDQKAIVFLIERVLPQEREIPVQFPMSGTLVDRGYQVLDALSDGTLAPGQASRLLATLSYQAKLIETEELEQRIAALEKVAQVR